MRPAVQQVCARTRVFLARRVWAHMRCLRRPRRNRVVLTDVASSLPSLSPLAPIRPRPTPSAPHALFWLGAVCSALGEDVVFDMHSFTAMSSHPKRDKAFLEALCSTQCFSAYITARMQEMQAGLQPGSAHGW